LRALARRPQATQSPVLGVLDLKLDPASHRVERNGHEVKLSAKEFSLLHFLLRRRFLTISFKPEDAESFGWRIRVWDFLFYVSFGVAVTLAVPVAGVLLVFTMLVVPAVVAFLFTRNLRTMMLISWGTGALASLLGLYVSYVGNFPTGPLIVCMYGLVLLAAGGLYKLHSGKVVAADAGSTPQPRAHT